MSFLRNLLSVVVHSVAHVTRNQRRCQINVEVSGGEPTARFPFHFRPVAHLLFPFSSFSRAEILLSDSLARALFSTVVVVRLGRRFVARVIVPIPPENPDLFPSPSLFRRAALPTLGHTSAYPFFTHKSRPLQCRGCPTRAGTLPLLFPLLFLSSSFSLTSSSSALEIVGVEKYKKIKKQRTMHTGRMRRTLQRVTATAISSLCRETRGASVSSFGITYGSRRSAAREIPIRREISVDRRAPNTH